MDRRDILNNDSEQPRPNSIELYLLRLEQELNARQMKFCLHYLESFNVGESYLKAYSPEEKMSIDVASSSGSRLLRKPEIKQFIRLMLYYGMEEMEFKLLNSARTYKSVEKMALNEDFRYPPNVELEANRLIGQAQGLFNSDSGNSIAATKDKLADKVFKEMVDIDAKREEDTKKAEEAEEAKGECDDNKKGVDK